MSMPAVTSSVATKCRSPVELDVLQPGTAAESFPAAGHEFRTPRQRPIRFAREHETGPLNGTCLVSGLLGAEPLRDQ